MRRSLRRSMQCHLEHRCKPHQNVYLWPFAFLRYHSGTKHNPLSQVHIFCASNMDKDWISGFVLVTDQYLLVNKHKHTPTSHQVFLVRVLNWVLVLRLNWSPIHGSELSWLLNSGQTIFGVFAFSIVKIVATNVSMTLRSGSATTQMSPKIQFASVGGEVNVHVVWTGALQQGAKSCSNLNMMFFSVRRSW